MFARPSFQNSVANVVGAARGIPDVSMAAAVNGGALVYLGFSGNGLPAPGWYPIGGTSEATPLFSGVVAVADQAAHHRLGVLGSALYGGPSGLVDITSGNNTVSFRQEDNNYTVAGFDAVPGYDMASGLGTIDGERFVAAFAH